MDVDFFEERAAESFFVYGLLLRMSKNEEMLTFVSIAATNHIPRNPGLP